MDSMFDFSLCHEGAKQGAGVTGIKSGIQSVTPPKRIHHSAARSVHEGRLMKEQPLFIIRSAVRLRGDRSATGR